MVGERYSHSLDIGEELEKEKEEEKKGEQPQLPCFCSPKIRPKASESEQEKKDEPAPEPEKNEEPEQEKEEPAQEENQEAVGEETAEQQVSASQEAAKEAVPQQETREEPRIEVKPADISEDSGWEQMEDVAPAEPQSIPDPVEEDINAIITKEVPVLNPRKSVIERLLEHQLLLVVAFVAVIAGIFFAWKIVLPEPAAQNFELEPSAAFVPANITLLPAQIPELQETAQEIPLAEIPEIPKGFETAVAPAVPEEVFEEELPVQANASSVDELPEFFAQRLKD